MFFGRFGRRDSTRRVRRRTLTRLNLELLEERRVPAGDYLFQRQGH
jgi:hypothetical protein